jgi:hypothetical protein
MKQPDATLEPYFPPCSDCGQPHRRIGQRYCWRCHAERQRQWRVKQRLRVRDLVNAAWRVKPGASREAVEQLHNAARAFHIRKRNEQ